MAVVKWCNSRYFSEVIFRLNVLIFARPAAGLKVSSRRRSVPLSWSVLEWCRGVGVKVVRWPEEQQQQHQQHQHKHSTALSTCQDTLTIITFLYMQRTLFAFISCFCMVQKEIVFKLFGKMQSFGNETINQTHDSHLTGCQDWCSEKLSLEYAVNLAHTLLVPPQSSFRADIISLCTRC